MILALYTHIGKANTAKNIKGGIWSFAKMDFDQLPSHSHLNRSNLSNRSVLQSLLPKSETWVFSDFYPIIEMDTSMCGAK